MKKKEIIHKVNETDYNYMPKVYLWAALGLSLSGFIAFLLLKNYGLVISITNNYLLLGAIILAFLGFVFWLTTMLETMDLPKIIQHYLLFSAMNGLIIPLFFQFFTEDIIVSTFFILAFNLLIMSGIGHYFRQDLSSWPMLILLFIVGIILNILANLIWRIDKTQMITTGISALILTGLAAYYCKNKNIIIPKNGQISGVFGAFALLINLYFLFIAAIMEANKSSKRIDS